MHDRDEEWISEWLIELREEKKFKEIHEEWDIEKMEDHYNNAETSLFKAGVNRGIDIATDLFEEKFYNYHVQKTEKAKKMLDEIEEDLEEEEGGIAEELKEEIEECRRIIRQSEKKRKNFLEPLIEGNIEEIRQE